MQASFAMDMKNVHYEALAEFRYQLRCFLVFSEREARDAGLTPQHHQAMLAIRGSSRRAMTIGELAERLVIAPHSASGLAARLRKAELLDRITGTDRRVGDLRLTDRAERLLEHLARVHHLEVQRIKRVLSTLLDQFEDLPS